MVSEVGDSGQGREDFWQARGLELYWRGMMRVAEATSLRSRLTFEYGFISAAFASAS